MCRGTVARAGFEMDAIAGTPVGAPRCDHAGFTRFVSRSSEMGAALTAKAPFTGGIALREDTGH